MNKEIKGLIPFNLEWIAVSKGQDYRKDFDRKVFLGRGQNLHRPDVSA